MIIGSAVDEHDAAAIGHDRLGAGVRVDGLAAQLYAHR
jgi:hypothetical protein